MDKVPMSYLVIHVRRDVEVLHYVHTVSLCTPILYLVQKYVYPVMVLSLGGCPPVPYLLNNPYTAAPATATLTPKNKQPYHTPKLKINDRTRKRMRH